MKIRIFKFIIFFLNFYKIYSENLIEKNINFAVVLMVKDEESVINDTLEQFVKTKIDSFLILDTGSKDKTVEVVTNYFKDNDVKNAYIFQEPFIDFSVSRNRGIQLAKEKFPKSDFLLFIDAEWYIQNVEGLIEFCKKNANDNCPVYLIRIADFSYNAIHDLYAPRLMKTNSSAKFKGRVHETLISGEAYKRIPSNIFFEYKPKNKGIKKTLQRLSTDCELLQKDLSEEPNNPRIIFHLAGTYECMGDFYNAFKYLEIRSKINGYIEENYETFFRLGIVTQHLSNIDKNYTWQQAEQYFLRAYCLLPHRAEPLIKIASHYWPSNIPLCFLYAKAAYDLPYPENDILYINKQVYEYEKYNLVSGAAWHIGAFDIGEHATLCALKNKLPHLYHNLMCYIEAKQNLDKKVN